MNKHTRVRGAKGRREDKFVPYKVLITSVRITQTPGHDQVEIFNRGQKTGDIFVRIGDGAMIALLLLPSGVWEDESPRSR
jgi:hypothetical protein